MIDPFGERRGGGNEDQTIRVQPDLLDQFLGIGDPFPGPEISLLITAGLFRAGNQIDQVGPRLQGPQEMQRLDSSTAGQGKKFYPRA